MCWHWGRKHQRMRNLCVTIRKHSNALSIRQPKNVILKHKNIVFLARGDTQCSVTVLVQCKHQSEEMTSKATASHE